MQDTSDMPQRSRTRFALGTAAAGIAAGLWMDGRRRARRAEALNPPDGRFVPAAGGRMHLVDKGAGPPVVLIHGAAFLHGDMMDGHLGDLLTRRYRALSVDRPGHGYTDDFPFHMAPQHQAAILRDGIRRLGVRRPVLVGHSLGGAVALAWALAHPSEVAGVVALAPQCYPDATLETTLIGLAAVLQAIPGICQTIGPVGGRMMMPGMMRQAFSPQPIPEAFRRAVPEGLLTRPKQIRSNGLELFVNLPAMQFLERCWPRLRVPVSLLAGTSDRVLAPERHAVRLAREVPGARLRLLPGLGHMLHYFAPEVVMQEIDRIAGSAAAARGND